MPTNITLTDLSHADIPDFTDAECEVVAGRLRAYTVEQIRAVVIARIEDDAGLFVEDWFDPDDEDYHDECDAAIEMGLTLVASDTPKVRESLRSAWERGIDFNLVNKFGWDAGVFEDLCGDVVGHEFFRWLVGKYFARCSGRTVQ